MRVHLAAAGPVLNAILQGVAAMTVGLLAMWMIRRG